MEFNLTRDRGWTFADPLADRFERHALCKTFLNLKLHLFEHLRFSN